MNTSVMKSATTLPALPAAAPRRQRSPGWLLVSPSVAVLLLWMTVPLGMTLYFSLIRYKINCCAADATPLKAVILLDPKGKATLPIQQYRDKWVDVTGVVAFRARPGGAGYGVALILYPNERTPLSQLIEPVPMPANPFIY